MGATLDYISAMFGSGHKTKRRKHLNTVELKVRMDCDGCELKIKKLLSSMKGVESVEVNRKQQKVTVIGFVEPNKVLKKVVSTGKKAEMWPYVPYNLVAHPYAVQSYDKKAPPGFVRNAEVVTKQEDQFTNLFSDDNPNACSVITSVKEAEIVEDPDPSKKNMQFTLSTSQRFRRGDEAQEEAPQAKRLKLETAGNLVKCSLEFTTDMPGTDAEGGDAFENDPSPIEGTPRDGIL